MSRIDDVLARIDPSVRLDPDLVPRCSMDLCRRFDGKRCVLTGNEPEQTCRPAVTAIVQQVNLETE